MEIGKVIYERRRALGWTQEELGAKLETTGATINRWENGERQVKVSKLEQIANVLGIEVSDLMRHSASLAATPGHRLRAARIAAGFETMASAVDHFRWKSPTYSAHERDRGFRAVHAKTYADAFGTTPEWLMFGDRADNISATLSPPTEPVRVDIDPVLLAAWNELSREGRRKLVQIAVILAQRS